MHNYFIGELLGVTIVVSLGCGVNANSLLKKSKGEGCGYMCGATSWGLAAIIGAFVAQASGSVQADLNPVVTIAKYFLHTYTSSFQVIASITAQLIGAFIGSTLVWLAYLPHWKETPNKIDKLQALVTYPAIRNYKTNLLCEIIGAFILVLGGGAISASSNLAEGLAPYMVGMLVWVLCLSLGGPTGIALNPARDLGARLAHFILPIAGKGSSDWHYAWVPIIGPIAGGMIAVFVRYLFFL